MKVEFPINVPEIERLTKEFVERVADVAGIKPDVDMWFHTTCGDTRPLAHDSLLVGGFQVVKVPFYNNPDKLSHISVRKDISNNATIIIHVDPRLTAPAVESLDDSPATKQNCRGRSSENQT